MASISARLVVVVALVAAPEVARAQGSYRALPLGGRSALEGNTGVAASRDASAAFLNPATLASLDNPQMAFSMNFFRFTYVSMGSWFQPGPVDQQRFPALSLQSSGADRVDFSALPSSLCLYLVLGQDPFREEAGQAPRPTRSADDKRPRLAFCFASNDLTSLAFPARNYTGLSGPVTSQHAQGVVLRFERYSVGPTLGFRITDDVSIGASLHAIVTDFDNIYATSAITYQSSGVGTLSGLNFLRSGVSTDLAALIGATWRPSPRWAFGVSFYTPTVNIYGLSSASVTTHTSGPAGDSTRMLTEDGNFRATMPARLSLGAAWDLPRTHLELDAFLAPGIGDAFRMTAKGQELTLVAGRVTPTATSTYDRISGADPSLNVAVGVEHFVRPGFSLLGGAYTDFNPISLSNDPPRLDAPLAGDKRNDFALGARSRLALTLGFGSYGPSGDVLFGAEMSYLWGKVAAPNQYQAPPTFAWSPLYGFQMIFVLSGSTDIRSLKRAVTQVEHLVSDTVTPGNKKGDGPAPPKNDAP